MRGDELPNGLDFMRFDFGVNAGPAEARQVFTNNDWYRCRWWYRTKYISKVAEYVEEHGLAKAIDNYQEARQSYYEKLSTFSTFGRGWTRELTKLLN